MSVLQNSRFKFFGNVGSYVMLALLCIICVLFVFYLSRMKRVKCIMSNQKSKVKRSAVVVFLIVMCDQSVAMFHACITNSLRTVQQNGVKINNCCGFMSK